MTNPRRDLKIGCAFNSIVGTDRDTVDIDTRFRMVKESGVYDYIDKTPPTGEIELYQRASEKHGVPLRAGGFYYVVGRDEPLLEWHLRISAVLGSTVLNMQVMTKDIDGRPVSNEQVAELYLWAAERAERLKVTPALEIHINMWSENFRRVAEVGALVEQRGVKFNITLDHSHVIFKIDNPKEQLVQDMQADILAGRVQLDPRKPGSITQLWIDRNWVAHLHARPSAPNNPVNVWATHPDGRYGRGVQYPFIRPKPGEWHSAWDEADLDAWKEVVRQLFRFHARQPESCLGQASTEVLPFTDYGAGARYSIFEHSIAVAKWLRATWIEESTAAAATAQPA